VCGKYQALLSAAALDAQLTALSTGTSEIMKRPEMQRFSHEFMLHRSESGCHCPAPVRAPAIVRAPRREWLPWVPGKGFARENDAGRILLLQVRHS
jgi:hypothetical protein